ncbi:hypothetical protein [Nonomuraea angiospora]
MPKSTVRRSLRALHEGWVDRARRG